MCGQAIANMRKIIHTKSAITSRVEKQSIYHTAESATKITAESVFGATHTLLILTSRRLGRAVQPRHADEDTRGADAG